MTVSKLPLDELTMASFLASLTFVLNQFYTGHTWQFSCVSFTPTEAPEVTISDVLS